MIMFLAVSALDDDTIDWGTLVVFTVASLFAARLFLPLDLPPEALTEASRADFPQQFFWSTSYSLAPSGYYLNLLTALPVVLPVLIERIVRGGFLLRKRECTQASGSWTGTGAMDTTDQSASWATARRSGTRWACATSVYRSIAFSETRASSSETCWLDRR